MTDPVSLEPVTGESTYAPTRLAGEMERDLAAPGATAGTTTPTDRRNDPTATDEERLEAFTAHVHAGGKVEAGDWMPDEYRNGVLRFVEMHANSELMGILPEREWIMKAPTLQRKLLMSRLGD